MTHSETTTSSPKTYNGWTNYETWAVNLWIDSEEGSQRYWSEQAQSAWDNAEASTTFTRTERATLDLTSTLKEHFEDESQDVLGEHQASMWADLLSAALSEVDWREIATSMLENVEQETCEHNETDGRCVNEDVHICTLAPRTEEDESEDEPDSDAGDITTEDHCHFYQYGKLWLTLDTNAAAEDRMIPAIRAQMDADGFFPNVWFISDHGNAHLMSLEVALDDKLAPHFADVRIEA